MNILAHSLFFVIRNSIEKNGCHEKIGPDDKKQGSQMGNQLIRVLIDVMNKNNKNKELYKMLGI